MDHIHNTTFAEETLKATLNCYQIASVDSLSGPGGLPALVARMWYKQNKELPPIQQQPLVQIPYLIPNDKTATRSETMLAGEKIACFIVGGEKRLCLPQILTSVLREYSIAQINQACAELHIYCSRCLPEQLEILKALGILPINTAQCGLITKTDAERLVALLTDGHDPYKMETLPKDVDPESGIPVYHECFGRGYGRLYPKLYTSRISACILCKDCCYMYSPQRFITHSDRSSEKRTCHWGFDPENWRSYLLLPKDLDGPKREEYEKMLDHAKSKFSGGKYDANLHQHSRSTATLPSASKRRIDSEQESPTQKKKIKEEEDGKAYESGYLRHPYASIPYGAVMRHSAFRPWSPRSASETPVAQDIPHLKGLVPIALDRRGFPQYVHSTTSTLSTQDSEFHSALPKTAPDSRHAASRPVPRHDERKKSAENDSRPTPSSPRTNPDRNNNRHDHHFDQGKHPVKLDQRSRSFEHPTLERQSNLSRSSTRISSMPETGARLPHLSPVRYVTASEPQKSSKTNILKEPTQEITRPVSRSREAAASAMLELKSAGQYRSDPQSPTRHGSPRISHASSQPIHQAQTASGASKSAGTVVPLDSSRQHYKWTIEGQSYIVSASGMQALDAIRGMLEAECSSGSGRLRLMHEFVKMKSLFEEKLDIEMRVRRDLQIELDRLKATSNDKLRAANEGKELLKQEMENMREEHYRRLEELKRRHGKPSNSDQCATVTELKELRLRIDELEVKNDKLRSCLLEEREKREKAETKRSETDGTRGRMSFYMESPLSRMVRDVTRKNNEEDKTTVSIPSYIPAQTSRKAPTPQDSSAAPASRGHRKSTLPPPLIRQTSLNNLPQEISIPNDLESQKIVVVS